MSEGPEREPWVPRLLRALVHAVSAAVFAYPLARGEAAWAAAGSVWGHLSTWVGIAAVVATLALFVRRRAPTATFGAAWLLLAYLPSSSLLVTLRTLVNDRALYPALPAAGLLAGLALARCGDVEQAAGIVGALVEGVSTARAVGGMAAARGIDMPILGEVLAVLDGERTAASAVERLLAREPVSENA